MKKVLISALSATILVSGLSVNFANAAFAETDDQKPSLVQKKTVAYTKSFLLNELENSEGSAVALPYKDGILQLPEGYVATVVTNPDTGISFYKIEGEIQTYGIKKTAIVWAFRYGGKALSTVLDVVSDDTASYIRKNSGKIANAIEDAGAMIHGEIYQSLLSAGVPTSYARNIAWAIDAFLL